MAVWWTGHEDLEAKFHDVCKRGFPDRDEAERMFAEVDTIKDEWMRQFNERKERDSRAIRKQLDDLLEAARKEEEAEASRSRRRRDFYSLN